jgi:hypothetical protein
MNGTSFWEFLAQHLPPEKENNFPELITDAVKIWPGIIIVSCNELQWNFCKSNFKGNKKILEL